MAIIYTYPKTTSLENNDLLIVSKMDQEDKPTRSVSIANLANFINTTAGGPYLPLTGGNLTGDLTINATSASKSKFNIVGDRTKPSVITLEGTDNDQNWQVGDRIGGIDFYSAEQSGIGAGVKSSINYIVTTESGGQNALTIGMPTGGVNNTEIFRIEQNGDIGVKVSNPESILHLRDINSKIILQHIEAGGGVTGKTAMFTGVNNALKFSTGDGEGVTIMELAGNQRDISIFGDILIDNTNGTDTPSENVYQYRIKPSVRYDSGDINTRYPDLNFIQKFGIQELTYMSFKTTSSGSSPRIEMDQNLVCNGGSSVIACIKAVGRDIEVTNGAITNGLILESPDGTRYKITVANGGTLSVAVA